MLYDAILIDADDTLFDFRGAEKNAIGAIIQQLGILDEAAPQVYHRLNRACWEAFERGGSDAGGAARAPLPRFS